MKVKVECCIDVDGRENAYSFTSDIEIEGNARDAYVNAVTEEGFFLGVKALNTELQEWHDKFLKLANEKLRQEEGLPLQKWYGGIICSGNSAWTAEDKNSKVKKYTVRTQYLEVRDMDEAALQELFETAIDEDEVDMACALADNDALEFDRGEAFRYAVKNDCTEYVDREAEEIELNDCGDCSSYLSDAPNEEMEELLIEYGALRSMDDYVDGTYKIAIETMNDTILTFNEDFRKEVMKKVLEILGKTEKEFAEAVQYDEELDEDIDLCVYSYEDLCDMLCISVEGGKIQYDECWGEYAGELQTLLEDCLGYSFDFEGDSWKLETNGVYFIK